MLGMLWKEVKSLNIEPGASLAFLPDPFCAQLISVRQCSRSFSLVVKILRHLQQSNLEGPAPLPLLFLDPDMFQ